MMSHYLEIITYSVGLFIVGTLFGSFGGVILERLQDTITRDKIKSILIGRSQCTSCTPHRTLQRNELIPIISRLRTWGKCSDCQQNIPQRYLRVEIVSGLIFVMTYLITPESHLIRYLAINRLLLLLLVHDLRTHYLHNAVYYILAAVTIGYSITMRGATALISGAIRWGTMALIRRWASIYARKRYGQPEGIGSGDVLVMGIFGLLLPSIITDISIINIVRLFFQEMMVAGIVSLVLAYILNKQKAGQEIAFLPGIIIARWVLTILASHISLL